MTVGENRHWWSSQTSWSDTVWCICRSIRDFALPHNTRKWSGIFERCWKWGAWFGGDCKQTPNVPFQTPQSLVDLFHFPGALAYYKCKDALVRSLVSMNNHRDVLSSRRSLYYAHSNIALNAPALLTLTNPFPAWIHLLSHLAALQLQHARTHLIPVVMLQVTKYRLQATQAFQCAEDQKMRRL